MLYLLTTNKILELTPNYVITSEHNFTTDTSVYDFVVTENKLFYSAGKGKLGVLDLKTKIRNLIDLSALGLCNICPAPKNLGIYNNENIFFLLNNNLFFLNTYSNKIDSIYYRKKLIVEIKVKHSIVNQTRYYKWKLVGSVLIK